MPGEPLALVQHRRWAMASLALQKRGACLTLVCFPSAWTTSGAPSRYIDQSVYGGGGERRTAAPGRDAPAPLCLPVCQARSNECSG
jgi:hypothetical protein